jgi:hypothetical protein
MDASDGGVWKTANSGGSWVPLTDNPSLSIGAPFHSRYWTLILMNAHNKGIVGSHVPLP